MRWTFAALILIGCGTEAAPACPEGVALTDADLPCACHGTTVDALTCGEIQCEAGGITVLDTGDTTSDCTTTSPTGTDTDEP